MYKVILKREVDKWLAGVPAHIQRELVAALVTLGETPRPSGCRKLRAEQGWRIRAGNYRIIYDIDDDAQVVDVRFIGPRSAAYRRF